MTKSFYSPLGLRYRKLAAEGIIPGAIINPPKHGANSSLSRILNPIQLDLNHKTLAERHSDALHVEIGMTRALKEIPAGSSIFNLEKRPNKGGIYARAAGTSCILLKTQEIFVPNLQSPEVNKTRLMHCVIRLPSKKVIVLSGDCRAIIGQASNKDHSKRVLGKAGASR